MRQWVLSAALVLLGLSCNSVQAWNDVGHMLVARIAYEKLTDPERAAIAAMLRSHPHLQEILLSDRPQHASAEEWVFLRAATWPDKVRPPRSHGKLPVGSHPVYRFHHANWHFADFPYRPGQRETTLPNHTLPLFPVPHNPADRTHILEQLDHSYLVVRGSEREMSEPEAQLSPPEIRAIRLCWLMHLMGDIHQPLHVSSLVDDRIPSLQRGDEGGNKIAVRLNHASAPRKLHAIWDDVFGTHAKFDHVVQLAEMYTRDPRLQAARFPEFAAHKQAWQFAEESYQIAQDQVYQNGRLHYALWPRYESHEIQAADVPVLLQRDVDQLHATAERRVVLAGNRLAERLKFIVARDRSNGHNLSADQSRLRRQPISR